MVISFQGNVKIISPQSYFQFNLSCSRQAGGRLPFGRWTGVELNKGNVSVGVEILIYLSENNIAGFNVWLIGLKMAIADKKNKVKTQSKNMNFQSIS